jgi:hypothetical protein
MPRTSGLPVSAERTLSWPRRLARNLGLRLRRRIFLPGDSLADAVKRTAFFVGGWGALIGLLAWGAYAQGVLHGVGEGVVFCAALFALAVLKAPDFTSTDGSGRRQR